MKSYKFLILRRNSAEYFGLFRRLVETVPLGGKLDILQEGDPEGQKQAIPMCSKMSQMGKKNCLAEQRDLTGSCYKK